MYYPANQEPCSLSTTLSSSRSKCKKQDLRTSSSLIRSVTPYILDGEEVIGVLVLEPKFPGKAGILRTCPDVDALGWIELMPMNQEDAKAREGLSTPARGGYPKLGDT